MVQLIAFLGDFNNSLFCKRNKGKFKVVCGKRMHPNYIVEPEKTAIIIRQPTTRILITDTGSIAFDIVYPNNAVIILSGLGQANFEGFLHFGTSLIRG